MVKLLLVFATVYVYVLGKGADTGSFSCMGQAWHFLPVGRVNVVAIVALECDEEDELVSEVGESRVCLSGAMWFHTLSPDRKQFSLVVHRESSKIICFVFDLKQLVATHLTRDVFKVSKIRISVALIRPNFASVGTACNHLLLHGLSGDVLGEEEHLP